MIETYFIGTRRMATLARRCHAQSLGNHAQDTKRNMNSWSLRSHHAANGFLHDGAVYEKA